MWPERENSQTADASPLAEIARAAVYATGLVDYRRRVLDILAREVRFDAALIHALSPRVPLETAVVRGLDVRALARSALRWDELGDVLSPLRNLANRELVATDRQALPRQSGARRLLRAVVLRPFGQRAVCVVHLVVQERVVAAVVLLAKRPDAFAEPELHRLRTLAPGIAVGDALHQHLDGVRRASVPTRLVCVDQRLTQRQREVVEHIALGLTNAETGMALGVTEHAVRNQLARIFAAIGACNRADVVRLAVLQPVE